MKGRIQKASECKLYKKSFNSLYVWGFIFVLAVFIGVLYFLVKNNYVHQQPQKERITQDLPTRQIEWKIYTNEQMGISIKYPSDLKIIEDKDRTVLTPVRYIGHSIFIADAQNPTDVTKAIQIQIENSLMYEIPWSGGKTTTITKDNLYLYDLSDPNTEVVDFEGRPTMKSLDSSNLYGAHTKFSILDGNRLIQVKIDTKDATNTSFHDEVLSSFKFLN